MGHAARGAARDPGAPTEQPRRAAGSGLIWTWDDQRLILDAITDIVDSAEQDLILATYSIGGMAHAMGRVRAEPSLLFEPVGRAIQRGVRVRMLLRGRNISDAARNEAAAFAALGVEIHADEWNHAKAAIADGRRGALFSANFMSTMGLTGGIEVGVRLDGTAALDDAVGFFEHSIQEAGLEFRRDPAAAEVDQRLYFESMRPWPLDREIRVQATDTVWEQLSRATNGPVLYERDGDAVTLFGGTSSWQCTQRADGTVSVMPGRGRTPSTDTLLARWVSPRGGQREKEQVTHGVCPATLVRA
ncbi:phospholipase D-like domain-containing protein [Catellatospora coxensis]